MLTAAFLLTLSYSFVCSLLHPVFLTSRASRSVEIRDDSERGDREVIHTKTLKGYMHVPPWKGWAIRGQPAQQVRSVFVLYMREWIFVGLNVRSEET